MADGKLPPPIWTYHIQVNVYANHLNGKDTHLRSIRVFGPSAESDVAASAKEKAHAHVKKLATQRGPTASVSDVRYEHAYDTLKKIIEGRTDQLEPHYDFDLEDEAERGSRSIATQAGASSHDQLPAASRKLYLAHQLR
jgi:Anaphase-promoting complex, subunit 10 (APC10)